MSKLPDKLPAAYFFVQGAAGAIWWFLLFLSPSSRALFVPGKFPDEVLLSLFAADLIFVAGSIFVGWLLATGRPSTAACWFVAGATGYATLTCWGWTFVSGEAFIGSIVMTVALAGTISATLRSQR